MGRKKKYASNEDIVDLIIQYQETGVIPDELHLIFYDMAYRISNKPNFINYTMKEDMASDAYLKCLLAIKKFKIKRFNAFGYFSTVIHNHFLTAIGKMKKQGIIKERLQDKLYIEISNRYSMNININDLLEDNNNDDY